MWVDNERVITIQKRPMKSIFEIEQKINEGFKIKNSGEFLYNLITLTLQNISEYIYATGEAIEAAGIALEHIDFGGGLGIQYQDEAPPTADALWAKLLKKIDARGLGDHTLMIEPGRSLVGNAGVCLTEVLYLKPGEQKNFCIVDAAMNDLPRPAMYQAYHAIVPLEPAKTPAQTSLYDVVGPVCESGDWIGRDRTLAVRPGERLAVMSAGAYCMSMASNYNTRARAAEVLVDGDRATVIRQRESITDLFLGEQLCD
jgi:diaminopimelate decarboxylase